MMTLKRPWARRSARHVLRPTLELKRALRHLWQYCWLEKVNSKSVGYLCKDPMLSKIVLVIMLVLFIYLVIEDNNYPIFRQGCGCRRKDAEFGTWFCWCHSACFPTVLSFSLICLEAKELEKMKNNLLIQCIWYLTISLRYMKC